MTGNKFKRLNKDYLDGKRIEGLINPSLKELILIDMALDWGQIDILAPTFIFIEQLQLVRNKCKKVCSEYTISKEHF